MQLNGKRTTETKTLQRKLKVPMLLKAPALLIAHREYFTKKVQK